MEEDIYNTLISTVYLYVHVDFMSPMSRSLLLCDPRYCKVSYCVLNVSLNTFIRSLLSWPM